MHIFNPTTNTYITPRRGNNQAEIGDAKRPDKFLPRIKHKVWGDECNISFGLPDVNGATVSQDDQGKISWQRPDGVKAVFWDLDAREVGEDGGYEFEVHLPSKPESNILTLTLNLPKNVVCYYQPPLSQEEIDAGHSRPENVVGSYAVYHESKSGDYSKIGGNNYKAGKAFHIYRPEAVDNAGVKTWCDLIIDTDQQIANITVPQTFLDSAAYPVIVDPTFGYTTVGLSSGTNNGSTIGLCKYTAPLNTIVASITAYNGYFYGSTGNAIYSDNAGVPSSKLAEDSGNRTVSAANWYTTNLSLTLSANTNYWLAFWSSSYYYYYYDTGVTSQYSSFSGTFESWPASPGAVSYGSCKVSIYCTYTTQYTSSVGGATITPTGSLTKSASHFVGGTITPVGNMIKSIGKIIGGSITPSGILTKGKAYIVSVGNTVMTPIGSIRKLISKVFSSFISPTGNVVAQKATPVGVVNLLGEFILGVDLLAEFATEVELLADYEIGVELLAEFKLDVDLEAEFNLSVELVGDINVTKENQDFPVIPGDDRELNFTVALPTGFVLSSAMAITFSLGRGILTVSLGSGIIITGDNTLTVSLTASNTSGLSKSSSYTLKIINAAGKIATVARGMCTID